jgi:hypothetical protein
MRSFAFVVRFRPLIFIGGCKTTRNGSDLMIEFAEK